MANSAWRCTRLIGSFARPFQHQSKACFSNTSRTQIQMNEQAEASLEALLRSTSSGLKEAVNSRTAPRIDAYAQAGKEMESLLSDPHHLHIYSHRHNTHLTLTRPNGEPLISLSAGNVGFKKAQRGKYEAGFQLTSYVLRSISEKGLLNPQHKDFIQRLELVFRGWGEGRNAFQTALLGVEGKLLRSTVIKVSDATRLKIGGNRSRKPRRLG